MDLLRLIEEVMDRLQFLEFR